MPLGGGQKIDCRVSSSNLLTESTHTPAAGGGGRGERGERDPYVICTEVSGAVDNALVNRAAIEDEQQGLLVECTAGILIQLSLCNAYVILMYTL